MDALMIPIIGPALEVFGNILGIGRDYVSSVRKIKEAKVNAKLAVLDAQAKSAIKLSETEQAGNIQWDVTMAEASKDSWKDEWITILVSVPVIMCFIPATQDVVLRGFEILEELPEWFQLTIGVVVAASFGFRKVADVIGKAKGQQS